jgi:hypothetical protein
LDDRDGGKLRWAVVAVLILTIVMARKCLNRLRGKPEKNMFVVSADEQLNPANVMKLQMGYGMEDGTLIKLAWIVSPFVMLYSVGIYMNMFGKIYQKHLIVIRVCRPLIV